MYISVHVVTNNSMRCYSTDETTRIGMGRTVMSHTTISLSQYMTMYSGDNLHMADNYDP